MSFVAFKDQPRAITEAGALLPGASLWFTLTGTDTDTPAYNDTELVTPLPNRLTADGAGRFPFIFLDPAVTYRARLYHPDTGALVWEVDPLGTFPLTDSQIPLDDSGEPMPFAVLTFWRSQTTQLQDVFTDDTGATPLDNPLTANESGEFPPIYLDDANDYRVKLEDGDGVLVHDTEVQIVAGAVSSLVMTAGLDTGQSGGELFGAIGYGTFFESGFGFITEDASLDPYLPSDQSLTIVRLYILDGELVLRIFGQVESPPADIFASLSFIDKDDVPRVMLSSAATYSIPEPSYSVWSWAGVGDYFAEGGEYPLTFTP